MTNTSIASSSSLPAALAARARAASDGRLVLDVAAGLVVALLVAIWRPTAWPLALCLAVDLAAFGTWGIAERELQARVAERSSRGVVVALRALQWLSIAVGVGAAVVGGFVLLGIGLGTWIS